MIDFGLFSLAKSVMVPGAETELSSNSTEVVVNHIHEEEDFPFVDLTQEEE